MCQVQGTSHTHAKDPAGEVPGAERWSHCLLVLPPSPHTHTKKTAETNIQMWLMEEFLEGGFYLHVLKYWFIGWLKKTEEYKVLGVITSRWATHELEGWVHQDHRISQEEDNWVEKNFVYPSQKCIVVQAVVWQWFSPFSGKIGRAGCLSGC